MLRLTGVLFIAIGAIEKASVEGFGVVPKPLTNSCRFSHGKIQSVHFAKFKPSVPEYLVNENDEGENSGEDGLRNGAELEQHTSKTSEPLILPEPPVVAAETPHSMKGDLKPSTQFAALAPGTVVHIQVGDVSLARKAWKKRRRSGSPLLVPCSVLNVDRASTIRWNLIYILEKFGRSNASGIRMTLTELSSRHRTHLKSSLSSHAVALGYETPRDMVEALFNKKAQDEYGVKLLEANPEGKNTNENGQHLILQAPLSRFKAQKRANAAPILQFFSQQGSTVDTLQHTGVVRNRQNGVDMEAGDNLYRLQPLSAALRVSQEDVEAGTIHNGSFHAAVVFDYDMLGDGGEPLLTLSLNPARNQVRDRLKISDRKYTPLANPRYILKELTMGDGPMEGKVLRLIKGGALVDCGVGRRVNNTPYETVRVLGYLRYKDATPSSVGQSRMSGTVEVYNSNHDGDMDSLDSADDLDDDEWEEILSIDHLDADIDEDQEGDQVDDVTIPEGIFDDAEDDEFTNSEDITHMFHQNEDGSLTYRDPESGETQIIELSSGNDEVEYNDETSQDDEEDQPVVFAKPGARSFGGRMIPEGLWNTTPSRLKKLHVGDRIDLYVKSVSKQSNRLMLTMNADIKGKNAKQVKHETEFNKKLSRLISQIGGLQKVGALSGKEMDGVVRALSKTGDWIYVEPSDDSLPVGVAFAPKALLADIAQGDSVRIQVEGVDEDRGQLAMQVLRKL
jgi:hypothetical protein